MLLESHLLHLGDTGQRDLQYDKSLVDMTVFYINDVIIHSRSPLFTLVVGACILSG